MEVSTVSTAEARDDELARRLIAGGSISFGISGDIDFNQSNTGLDSNCARHCRLGGGRRVVSGDLRFLKP